MLRSRISPADGYFAALLAFAEREIESGRRQLLGVQPEIRQLTIDQLDNEEIGGEVFIRSENKQHPVPG